MSVMTTLPVVPQTYHTHGSRDPSNAASGDVMVPTRGKLSHPLSSYLNVLLYVLHIIVGFGA